MIACINLAVKVVQKVWTAVTHKYATAVERIYRKFWVNNNKTNWAHLKTGNGPVQRVDLQSLLGIIGLI